MLRIERMQPGELEGDINPEDYGFEVIDIDPPSKEEAAERIGLLYAQTKERTGIIIPELEPFLDAVQEENGDTEVPQEVTE